MIGQYRIRRLALQLQEFTVRELEAAADATPQMVRAFIHQELDLAGTNLVKRDQIEGEGKPGRPPLRYILTQEGTEVLAKKNLALARQLNEMTSPSTETALATATAIPASGSSRSGIARNAVINNMEQATIGKSLVIKGEVTGSESLYIDGRIEVLINLPGNRVTVGRNGQVQANINAKEVVILGKVKGNVTASDRVDIRNEGALGGDVVCQRILIEDGAWFKGSIDIRKPREAVGSESKPGPAESATVQGYASASYERMRK